MSEFRSNLVVTPKTDKIWILLEPLIYYSDILGREIKVPTTFETDLASVPRVPIVYQLWGARCHYESVLHDYLFRYDSKPYVPYSVSNRVFREAMIVRGKPWYIREPMYAGVVIGGWGAYHKRSVYETL